VIGGPRKSDLTAEGLRIFHMLTSKYGMSEDKALQLMKELLSPLMGAAVMKSQGPDPAVISLQRELAALRKQHNDLLERIRER
jgi:hypothetical protein